MTENRPREAPAIVELSWFDVMQAGMGGICRYMKAVEKARPQRYGEVSTNRWGADIEGCLGEQVLAKFTGRYWDGALRDEARPGDVGDMEARHSNYPGAHLCIHKGDADDHIFVLVTGSLVGRPPWVFRVVGWISGAHGKREEWWGDVKEGKNRPAFWVPQPMLHAPQALREYPPEELRTWPAKWEGRAAKTLNALASAGHIME